MQRCFVLIPKDSMWLYAGRHVILLCHEFNSSQALTPLRVVCGIVQGLLGLYCVAYPVDFLCLCVQETQMQILKQDRFLVHCNWGWVKRLAFDRLSDPYRNCPVVDTNETNMRVCTCMCLTCLGQAWK